MSSTTSPTSFGGRKPLATMHFSLREPCPERLERAGKRRRLVVSPERHEVLRLAVPDAAELDLRGRVGRDPPCLRQRSTHIFRADRRRTSGKHEPCADAPCGKAREVYDRRGHECPVRDDDLAPVGGPQLRGAE